MKSFGGGVAQTRGICMCHPAAASETRGKRSTGHAADHRGYPMKSFGGDVAQTRGSLLKIVFFFSSFFFFSFCCSVLFFVFFFWLAFGFLAGVGEKPSGFRV